MMKRLCWITSVAALFVGLSSAAIAAPLLKRVDEAPARRSAVGKVARLVLDRAVLEQLRGSDQATLADFPLGATGSATINVERFEPFVDGAGAILMTADGPRQLALPSRVYFRGHLPSNPEARVVLVAGSDFVRGFVVDGSNVYRFGPDARGEHVAWSLSDADPGSVPTSPLCRNDEYPELAVSHRSATRSSPSPARNARGPYNPTLLTEIYLETDQEFLELFASSAEALDYLADLAAAVSGIFDADLDVRVVFRTIRLWESTDPWTSSSTGGMLDQVRNYWTENEAATPRDLVHFLSGKGVTGGVAFLDVLCDTNFGYGVSTVFGSFDIMNPNDTWDITVVAHEVGHNFGSPHTHCYNPPVDNCYNGEAASGCYAGAESLPPGGGTIMSYCHLLPGGNANVNLTFGTTVSDLMRTGATNGACIGNPCGDGILDPGEACDDGNISGGDCCSANCLTATANGTSCDDGEQCTLNDQCASGSCTGTIAVNGTGCDDGSQCTTENCQSGECVTTAAPAAVCKHSIEPSGSKLLLKNPVGGKSDAVGLRWGKGEETLPTDFGDPLATDDYDLCIYDADNDIVLSAQAPAGGTCGIKSCWKATTSGFAYSDKLGTPSGVSKINLKAGPAGKAVVILKGKGAPLQMTPIDDITLPLVVQVRGNGQCWEETFSVADKRDEKILKAKSD